MVLLINGSTREGAQTHEICRLIIQKFHYHVLNLDDANTIPKDYLQGIPNLDIEKYSTYVMVIPSYYVLPSPVFLNFFNQLSGEQVHSIFSGKKILIVSVQDGENLNEIHVDSVRRYFNKMFHYHKVQCNICIDFCMVNRSLVNRNRLLQFLEKNINNSAL